LITVVGHAAVIAAGEWVTALGEWPNDRTHGQQFKSRFIRTSAPTSIEGIEKYLGSGMIRGIGPVHARKMVRAFGEMVFDLIEAEPIACARGDGRRPRARQARHRRVGRAEDRPGDHRKRRWSRRSTAGSRRLRPSSTNANAAASGSARSYTGRSGRT
jgi:hypothetical protein